MDNQGVRTKIYEDNTEDDEPLYSVREKIRVRPTEEKLESKRMVALISDEDDRQQLENAVVQLSDLTRNAGLSHMLRHEICKSTKGETDMHEVAESERRP